MPPSFQPSRCSWRFTMSPFGSRALQSDVCVSLHELADAVRGALTRNTAASAIRTPTRTTSLFIRNCSTERRVRPRLLFRRRLDHREIAPLRAAHDPRVAFLRRLAGDAILEMPGAVLVGAEVVARQRARAVDV